MKQLITILFFLSISGLNFGQSINKCFSNGGLKYRSTIKIQIVADDTIKGMAISDEYDDTPIEQTSFTGIKKGDTLFVKFNGNPPISGSASEWTDKPWIIKKAADRETLIVVFYEMNYDTRIWGYDEIEFISCEKESL
jgi:hypothetical protein